MKKLRPEQRSELIHALGIVAKYTDRFGEKDQDFTWTFIHKGMVRYVEVYQPKAVIGWTMEEE